MTSLICGSMAYDTIMEYPGCFPDVLVADALDRVNVSFLVPNLRRFFGGCAANIAYNLKLLGGDPLILASVGQDSQPYLERLATLGIRCEGIRVWHDLHTAQCFITTDRSQNQINVFHEGAMSRSHNNIIPKSTLADITHAIVSPDGREGMLHHAQCVAEQNIPLIFDPGQGLPMFNGESLKHFLALANIIIMNAYELTLFMQRTHLSRQDIAQQVDVLIITQGAKGATIDTANEHLILPAVPAQQVVDPTGCGDAFRAGVLYGLSQDMDWQTTGQLANLMGSIKVAHAGTQTHALDRTEIEEQFYRAFGYHIFHA